MSIHPAAVKTYDLLPDTAPFDAAQRAWLSGFFAGYLKLDTAAITALSPGEAQALLEPESADDAPWHDPTMAIADRMKLAEGRSIRQRLFAAMAQQDCGQCGYQCATYSAAIASGSEARLNLCAPGGKETLRAVKTLLEEQPAAAITAPAVAAPAPVSEIGTSRDYPAGARFLSRRKLNGQGSEKETYHIEFDVGDLAYEVGDSFGIFAENDPRLVDAVIALMGARPDAPVGETTLRDALIKDRSLGAAPDTLFQLISFVTGGAQRLKATQLAKGEDPDGDATLLDVLGTLHKFSGLRLSPEAFVEALEPMQPRLYSISSSPKTIPGQLSLTVDCVRYRLGRRHRVGLASTFLAERAEPGGIVKTYVQKAHAFSLPDDPAKAIIMVGPGTGVAPFRAFLHERIAAKAPGRNWLFYGHQRQACDFFYADEFNAMKSSGKLQRLTLAWSRDGKDKIYVQDRMRDAGADLWSWLGDGAHFYVCGDAKRMAKDVEAAMVDIAATHGKMSREDAVAFVAGLKKAGRYQADVY